MFQDRRKLKGTDVFVNEDFCPGTIEVRKSQMDDFHTARKQGKIVYFNYRTLVVKDPRESGRGGQDNPPVSPSLPSSIPAATTTPAGGGASAPTVQQDGLRSPPPSPMVHSRHHTPVIREPCTPPPLPRTGNQSVRSKRVKGSRK